MQFLFSINAIGAMYLMAATIWQLHSKSFAMAALQQQLCYGSYPTPASLQLPKSLQRLLKVIAIIQKSTLLKKTATIQQQEN